jgi:glycerate 2-kinase
MREKITKKESNLKIGQTSIELDSFSRILAIGGGKAAVPMGEELEKILGSALTGGELNYPEYAKKPRGRRIEYNPASHPIPSEAGVRGVDKMLELVGKPRDDDLIICLISGGGSALMPKPAEGVTLEDKKIVTELLLKSGANIAEINCVRKHLSAFKGGRLAENLYPARVVSLIISDVVGDSLDAIASGPTAPDPTTFSDAMAVIEKYELQDRIPFRARKMLEGGVRGKIADTPKSGSKVFAKVSNFLIGTNRNSCERAASYLNTQGYETMVLTTHLQGEARTVGQIFAGVAQDIVSNSFPLKSPAAMLAGGETTVRVTGKGVGGRNQELALSAAIGIGGLRNVVVASMGTDGVDGPTNAAGAIASGGTISKAKRLRIDAREMLENNDSHTFFMKTKDLIVTGPTGTNVNDIAVVLVGKSGSSAETRFKRSSRKPPRRKSLTRSVLKDAVDLSRRQSSRRLSPASPS